MVVQPNREKGVIRFGAIGQPRRPLQEYEIDSDSIMAASFAALGM